VLIGISVFGQSEESNNIPHLNQHYFIPNSNTPAPFIKSQFGMNLGIASSNDFENVIIEIDGEKLLALKGSLIFADLNFDYQQKIKDWIAFHLNVGVTARIGTELQSILTQGVNTVSSFRMGWLVKLLKNEKNMLSANIQINNHGANFINIGDFITDLIKDSVKTSITKKVPILNGGIGLRYAHGFNEILGFQGYAGLAYGESFKRGESDFVYRLGGLFDINLATKTKVPLGFGISYSLTSVPDVVQVKGKSASIAGLKISYSGAPHFNLGLEISRSRVPIPDVEEKVNSALIFVTTKYYFN
jgi:hypothetical protein